MYEIKLKNNLMQKQLFTYISGGAKSSKFLVDKYYKENNKKLDVAYISLDTFYKKKEKFTEQDIKLIASKPNLITTEKDYMRLKDGIDECNYIAIKHAFFDNDIENLQKELEDFMSLNS